MASSRTTDVNLRIRAQTEGEKAIAGLAATLENLLDSARGGATDIQALSGAIGTLDKAAASIAAAQDKVRGSASGQAAALHTATAGIAEQNDRIATLRRGLDALSAEADKAFIGPRRDGLSASIKLVNSELADAQRQVAAFTRSYESNLAGLRTSRSSLLGLSNSGSQVAAGQHEAAAQIELTNQALREQAAAVEHVSDIQRRINEATGVSRPATGGSAAASASVFVENDADGQYDRRQARELQAAAAAHQAFEARVKEGAAALRVETAEAKKLQEAATLRNAAAAHQAFEARVKAGGDAMRAEAAEAERLALALQPATGKNKLGLFGLKPYELQNLGYQLNDVATQLASGTSLTRTLGQQGGQVLQLFPKITNAILAAFANPVFLGAAGVIGGIAFALKEAGDRAERLQHFSANLSFRPDGGSYNAGQLSSQAEDLQRLGANAKDAQAAIDALVDAGVAADAIGGLGRASQETAERLGQSLPDAAKAAAAAFTAGYAAVAAFDDKLDFLTATEREHIRVLFDTGNAEAARTEARLAYQRAEDGIADKARGPWSDAAHSLGQAWHSLVGFISDTSFIKAVIRDFSDLAGQLKEIGDLIASVTGGSKPDTSYGGRVDQLKAQIADLNKSVAEYEKNPTGITAHLLDATKRQLAEAKAQLAQLQQSAPDTVSDDPNSVAAKRRADELNRISVEDQLQRLRDAGQSRLLSAAERARRAELAGQIAAKDATDSVVAAAERRRAIAHETAAIERESDARSKAAASDREREIKSYLNAVVAAEGTGKNRAGSSAVGAGQFTRGTFVGLYRQINPSTSLSADQIAGLRTDSKIALQVLEVFTRQNAQLIQRAGKEVNGANLYLLHFLGAKTGLAALNSAGNTPIDQVIRRSDPRNADTIFSQNAAYLRTEKGKGPARTVAQLQTFLGAKVSDDPGSRAQTGLIENEANLIEDARKKQDDFNTAVRQGVEDRQRSIDALKAEAGLHGLALIAEQRRQAVAAAELELRQKAEDANKGLSADDPRRVTVSDDQVRQTKEFAAAAFDAAHAKEALNAALADAQRPLDDLTEQRDLLRSQADFLRSIGENSQADAVDRQIQHLGGSIADAYAQLLAFYQALSPQQRVDLGILDEGQLDNIITKLRQARDASQAWGKVLGQDGKTIAQAFASSAATAFTNFINKVAAGKNVFKSLVGSIREFASAFISSIAQMIVQILAYAAAVAILKALGVPVPSFSASTHHTGGIAGGSAGGVKRSVAPELFATAMRYHTGGIAGIAPDEVGAVLKRGEEVLTTGDPRHRANGGAAAGGAGKASSVNIVNSFDPNEVAELMLRTPAGERTILNMVRENQGAFKAALA